jgi:hypothetical protein
VEGDFALTVKVSGDFKPRPPSTSPGSFPYVAGGLLLWSDSENFVRLERAALLRDGQIVPHIAFLKQEAGEGKPVDYLAPFEGNDCYLRLERKDDRILGAVSINGTDWKQLNSTGSLGPGKLKVGLLAISTSSDPFSLKLDQLELKTKGAQAKQAFPEKTRP